MLSYARRLALLGLVGAAVLSNGAPTTGSLTHEGGEADLCLSKSESFDANEHALAPQLPPEAPKEKRDVIPEGPRASRRRIALYSAPPPEKTFCEPLPAWSKGLRPISFGMPDLHRIEPHLRYFAESPSGRGVVQTWLRRAGRYRHVVATELHNNRLPLDLQALVYIESGFNPNAISKAGAVGLWQLMPSTAKNLGLRVDHEMDERRNVQKSTAAAIEHLSDLYATFGSWELVFAAYDLGAKGLMRRMQEYGAMDYWSLSAIDGALPQETVDYVPKLLAFAVLLKNLDRFGFDDVQPQKPLFTSELDVPGGTTFALLARAAATSVFHLRELNPDILNGRKVPSSVSSILVPSFGLTRAQVMLPMLIGQNDGLENEVSDTFDWAKDHVDHKQKDLFAAAKKAMSPDRLAGFEDEPAKKFLLKRSPRALDLPSSPRSETSATTVTEKPAAPKTSKAPAKRLPS
jgi:hypothetical protein